MLLCYNFAGDLHKLVNKLLDFGTDESITEHIVKPKGFWLAFLNADFTFLSLNLSAS